MKLTDIKVGDIVYMPITVDRVYEETPYLHNGNIAFNIPYDDGDGSYAYCSIRHEQLLPFQREGEYRLTLDEIGEMLAYIDNYIDECGVIDYNRCPKAVAKRWLENRKKNDNE